MQIGARTAGPARGSLGQEAVWETVAQRNGSGWGTGGPDDRQNKDPTFWFDIRGSQKQCAVGSLCFSVVLEALAEPTSLFGRKLAGLNTWLMGLPPVPARSDGWLLTVVLSECRTPKIHWSSKTSHIKPSSTL